MRMTPDQQLIQRLRARVAELEEEVQAWRMSDRSDENRGRQAKRAQRARALVRRHYGTRVNLISTLLLLLVDKPGHPISHGAFHDAIGQDGHVPPWVYRSVVHHLRNLLGNLGLPDSLETVRGEGYCLVPDAAEHIRGLIDNDMRKTVVAGRAYKPLVGNARPRKERTHA